MTKRPKANDKSSTVSNSPPDGKRPINQYNEQTSAPIVETSNLTKRYGSTLALDHVSLSVEPGELVGLLGPNGAGKSMLIKVLTTITALTAGTATVAGVNVEERPTDVRNRISYVPQKTGVDDWLTGRISLELFARFYRISPSEVANRITEVLALVDLADHADQKTSTYSGGMKRRLEFVSGLVHHLEVVIFDEPTPGLDRQPVTDTRRHPVPCTNRTASYMKSNFGFRSRPSRHGASRHSSRSGTPRKTPFASNGSRVAGVM